MQSMKTWLLRAVGAVLLGLLAACGTVTHEYRHVKVGETTEWRPDKGERPAQWRIGEAQWQGLSVRYTVQAERLEREYVLDEMMRQVRQSQEADLTAIAVGALTGGMLCMGDPTTCFGGTGDWRNERRETVNARPSGRTRSQWEPAREAVLLDVTLRAEPAEGGGTGPMQIRRQLRTGADGSLTLALQPWLEQLPVRPLQATVMAQAGNGPKHTLHVEAERMAAMALNSVAWLPAPQRQARLLEQLKTVLIARDHAAAVKLYDALLALPLPQADSVHYMAAQSLRAVGQHDKARAQLELYLQRSGSGGVFSEEARAQLAPAGQARSSSMASP